MVELRLLKPDRSTPLPEESIAVEWPSYDPDRRLIHECGVDEVRFVRLKREIRHELQGQFRRCMESMRLRAEEGDVPADELLPLLSPKRSALGGRAYWAWYTAHQLSADLNQGDSLISPEQVATRVAVRYYWEQSDVLDLMRQVGLNVYREMLAEFMNDLPRRGY